MSPRLLEKTTIQLASLLILAGYLSCIVDLASPLA